MTAAETDEVVVEGWWRHFVRHGALPEDLQLVQGRLIRAVHKARLPSGEVFVKVMTFPRAKDRLRYSCRTLPAAYEARMLAAVGAVGVACPKVLAVRCERRWGLPRRSMLVLQALPVARAANAEADFADAAHLVSRLLEAGIEHRDLHFANFVRLQGGELAVLDLQSARVRRRGAGDISARLAAAARLWQGSGVADELAGAGLLHGGLLRDRAEVEIARGRAVVLQRRFDRGRVLRCLAESTQFTRHITWRGIEHRRRGPLPDGRWWPGDRTFLDAWLGQRAREVFEGRAPVFPALIRNWWWLGGGCSLYVPAPCEARKSAEVAEARNGLLRHAGRFEPERANAHGDGRIHENVPD